MSKDKKIINIEKLGFPWKTEDPFLFCAYHKDDYPKGNDRFGPETSLSGRNIGQDFVVKDGWRMYHGTSVPGFPSHPHRGFETLTVVKEGLVDHADSYGGAGRYGAGDMQWLTSGKGIQHSEMFPLLNKDQKNPLELFQIWLNLAKKDKFAEPHYKMYWNDDIPHIHLKDQDNRSVLIDVVTGSLSGKDGLPPPPDSWASYKENQVMVLTIKMTPGSQWILPKIADSDVNRTLYFYKGDKISLDDEEILVSHSIKTNPGSDITIEAGSEECYVLLLQGKPINEPVSQYGPFVMNSQNEIQKAFEDYEKTEFGGWPWEHRDQTHGSENKRFALFPDGTKENG